MYFYHFLVSIIILYFREAYLSIPTSSTTSAFISFSIFATDEGINSNIFNNLDFFKRHKYMDSRNSSFGNIVQHKNCKRFRNKLLD